MICVTFPNFIADQKQSIARDCVTEPSNIKIILFLLPFFKTVPLRNGSITRRILKQVVLDIAIPKVEDGINVNAVLPIKCEKAYIKADRAGTR